MLDTAEPPPRILGSFLAPHNKKVIEGLEYIQRREQSWGGAEAPGATEGAKGTQAGEKGGSGGPSASAQFPDRRGQPVDGLGSAPGNKDRRGNSLKVA